MRVTEHIVRGECPHCHVEKADLNVVQFETTNKVAMACDRCLALIKYVLKCTDVKEVEA